MVKHAILIPAYNTEKHLTELLERINQLSCSFLIVVVNDGSTDNTMEILQGLGKKINFQVISHQKNRGKGAALKSGIEFILQNEGIHSIIFLDADLQHPPEFIPEFIQDSVQNTADFVIGKRRFHLQEMPIARIMSNYLTTLLLSIKLGTNVYDSQSGFRLIKCELLREIGVLESGGYELETEILIKAIKKKARISSINIPTIYAGESSHINGLKLIAKFIKVFFKF